MNASSRLSKEQWDEIEDKLRKLNQLKEDSAATPGEAAAATEAIQRLLFKYNLTIEDFNLEERKKQKYHKFRQDLGAAIFLGWRLDLLRVVAKYNFCKVVGHMNGSRRLTTCDIIGTPENVRAVVMLHDYLVKEVRYLCNIGWKVAKALYLPSSGVGESTYRDGFYAGAVDTIHTRFVEMRRELEKETPKSTALVPLIEKELDEAAKELIPDIYTPKHRERKVNALGYDAGVEAGKHVKLQDSVN